MVPGRVGSEDDPTDLPAHAQARSGESESKV